MHRAYGLLLYRIPNARVTRTSSRRGIQDHVYHSANSPPCSDCSVGLFSCGASESSEFANRPLSPDSPRLTDLTLIKDALADDNRDALLMPDNAFGSPFCIATFRKWQLPRNLHVNDVWRRCHHPASELSSL